MQLWDFITPEELDALPEDHRKAFSEFVRIAMGRLSTAIARVGDDRDNYYMIEEARHGFMNVTVAAAKRYEFEPFASMEVPRIDGNDYSKFRQFKSDLDHYLTQLAIDNSIRGTQETVLILPQSKDRIRQHIYALRECIERSNITKAKREALLDRLDAFEKELEKRRISILSVSFIALQVLGIPGSLWASNEVTTKLITNIMQTVGEAKDAEEQNKKLPSEEPMKALSAPRKETSSRDFDDEIPF